MNIYGAQADMDFQREQFDKWKSTMFNSNARSGLNTPPPNIPAPLNVPRTTRSVAPINPYMLPDVNVYGTYD